MDWLRALWDDFAGSYDQASVASRRTPLRAVTALLAGFLLLVVPAYVPALARLGNYHSHWGVFAIFAGAIACAFGYRRSQGHPWGPVWIAADMLLWQTSLSLAVVTTSAPARYVYQFILGFNVIVALARDYSLTLVFALLLGIPMVGIVAAADGLSFTTLQSVGVYTLALWFSHVVRRERLAMRQSQQLREALDATDTMATRTFELALTRTALTVGHTLHELRNHLFVVGAALEYLHEVSLPDEETRAAVNDASKGFEAARAVLESTMAKLRQARQVASAEFDAAQVVTAVVMNASLRGVELQTDFDKRGFIVSGDEDGLRMAISNLLRNAVQAGAKNIEVVCRVNDGGDSLRVEVGDDGRGIPKDLTSEIFKAFETGHANEGGTGLGLYLTRRQVELMGGSIAVSPQPGRGTRFTIRLPGRVPSKA